MRFFVCFSFTELPESESIFLKVKISNSEDKQCFCLLIVILSSFLVLDPCFILVLLFVLFSCGMAVDTLLL